MPVCGFEIQGCYPGLWAQCHMDLRQGEHLKLVRYYVPVEGTKVTTKQGSPESLLGTEKDRDRNIRPREDCRTLFSRRTKRRVRIAGETLLGLGGGRKGGGTGVGPCPHRPLQTTLADQGSSLDTWDHLNSRPQIRPSLVVLSVLRKNSLGLGATMKSLGTPPGACVWPTAVGPKVGGNWGSTASGLLMSWAATEVLSPKTSFPMDGC